jgi:hypothetical protein
MILCCYRVDQTTHSLCSPLTHVLPIFPHLRHEVHILIECRTRHTPRWESARRDVYSILSDNFQGEDFFSEFTFLSQPDPAQGRL